MSSLQKSSHLQFLNIMRARLDSLNTAEVMANLTAEQRREECQRAVITPLAQRISSKKNQRQIEDLAILLARARRESNNY